MTSIYIYELLHSKQKGNSRSCYRYFPHLNNLSILIWKILANSIVKILEHRKNLGSLKDSRGILNHS